MGLDFEGIALGLGDGAVDRLRQAYTSSVSVSDQDVRACVRQ